VCVQAGACETPCRTFRAVRIPALALVERWTSTPIPSFIQNAVVAGAIRPDLQFG